MLYWCLMRILRQGVGVLEEFKDLVMGRDNVARGTKDVHHLLIDLSRNCIPWSWIQG